MVESEENLDKPVTYSSEGKTNNEGINLYESLLRYLTITWSREPESTILWQVSLSENRSNNNIRYHFFHAVHETKKKTKKFNSCSIGIEQVR